MCFCDIGHETLNITYLYGKLYAFICLVLYASGKHFAFPVLN